MKKTKAILYIMLGSLLIQGAKLDASGSAVSTTNETKEVIQSPSGRTASILRTASSMSQPTPWTIIPVPVAGSTQNNSLFSQATFASDPNTLGRSGSRLVLTYPATVLDCCVGDAQTLIELPTLVELMNSEMLNNEPKPRA